MPSIEEFVPFPHILLITFLDRARFQEKYIQKGDSECWPWIAGGTEHGDTKYGQFWLHGRHYVAHRVAYFFHYKQDPKELLVMHSCNNTLCCNPAHLSLGTHGDNNKYSFECERKDYKGENNHAIVKLTEQDVLEIRASNLSYQEEATKRNVSLATIYDVRNYRSWRHI